MKKTRILSLIAASALLAGVLGGCTKENGGNAATTAADTTKAAASTTAGGTTTAETYEFTVTTMRWGAMGDSFANSALFKGLEEETGVKINWDVRSSNDWEEQLSLLFASEMLPDMFMGNQTIRSSDITMNIDYFVELTGYIDQYMPNLQKAMAETPALKKACTFADGNIYSLPTRLPSRPLSHNHPIINKTWLDNLGLEVPTTTDELVNVLKAFKEQDANQNGDPNDEIPYTFNTFPIDFISPFGVTDVNGSGMMMKNGQPQYIFTSEEYKNGLIWTNMLYNEGVIDSEVFTMDDTIINAKYNPSDAARVGFTYQWTPDAVFGGWSDQYIAIEPLTGPDGKKYQQGDKDGMWAINGFEAEITTACKNPEVAAQWLDNFYTTDVAVQNFWGSFGEVTQKNADGTITILDPAEGTSADAWYWDSSMRDFGPGYCSPADDSKIIFNPKVGDGLKKEIDKLGAKYVTDAFPRVTYTVEELDETAILAADIDTYVETTRAKWITKGGIEAEWDAYISQLNAMGLDRLLEIRANAYARYMS